jgi:fluoride exporter
MLTYLLVALGGAIGSIARLWLGVQIGLLTGLKSPWGTVVVNILGSLVIGFVATLTGPNGRVVAPIEARAFVMIGLCGGFTTFSAFSLQTLELARDGRLLLAAANIGLSVLLCLVAVALGHWLATLFGRA